MDESILNIKLHTIDKNFIFKVYKLFLKYYSTTHIILNGSWECNNILRELNELFIETYKYVIDLPSVQPEIVKFNNLKQMNIEDFIKNYKYIINNRNVDIKLIFGPNAMHEPINLLKSRPTNIANKIINNSINCMTLQSNNFISNIRYDSLCVIIKTTIKNYIKTIREISCSICYDLINDIINDYNDQIASTEGVESQKKIVYIEALTDLFYKKIFNFTNKYDFSILSEEKKIKFNLLINNMLLLIFNNLIKLSYFDDIGRNTLIPVTLDENLNVSGGITNNNINYICVNIIMIIKIRLYSVILRYNIDIINGNLYCDQSNVNHINVINDLFNLITIFPHNNIYKKNIFTYYYGLHYTDNNMIIDPTILYINRSELTQVLVPHPDIKTILFSNNYIKQDRYTDMPFIFRRRNYHQYIDNPIGMPLQIIHHDPDFPPMGFGGNGNYKEKYLKYKLKYLNLKYKISNLK